jgi:hypothetical protein
MTWPVSTKPAMTPNLNRYEVHWPVSTDNIPEPRASADEFLRDRFIEDVLDVCPDAGFVIIETRMPMDFIDSASEIVFHIATSNATALELQAQEFEIEPLDDIPWDRRACAHDGMTWGELLGMLQRMMQNQEIKPEEIAAVTDDNDPDAPWFILTGTVRGDNGPYFTAVEFKP